MKKIALVFVLAVFAPSLVLAWLAVRSLRDQQLVLESEQARLYQRVSDSLAKAVNDFVAVQQRDFTEQVEAFLAAGKHDATGFDAWLVQAWPLAEVGFAVAPDAKIFSPSPTGRPAARRFLLENGRFLINREIVAVYNTASGKVGFGGNFALNNLNNGVLNAGQVNTAPPQSAIQIGSGVTLQANNAPAQPGNVPSQVVWKGSGSLEQNPLMQQTLAPQQAAALQVPDNFQQQGGQQLTSLLTQIAAVTGNGTLQSAQNPQPIQLAEVAITPQPQQAGVSHVALPQKLATFSQSKNRNVKPEKNAYEQENSDVSKIESTDAEFREVITSSDDGTLARFLQNKLNVMFWHRPTGGERVVFGAQLDLNRLTDGLKKLILLDAGVGGEICAALLDDSAKPVALSREGFTANWKSPFVATEIGEALPHWEVAIYPLDPAKLHRSARVVQLTIAMLVAVLLGAIGVGSWLIVADLSRELAIARQKTDFVSNVSHELKTPLTSIRMFSDLLAEGRVADEAKRLSYLGIISAEAARLTRLINNVLDFTRLERGEKMYQLQRCDVAGVVRDTLETYRPQLEQNGFRLECALPTGPLFGDADTDALAQVIVNLVSNAEKYSNDAKEIRVEVVRSNGITVRVLDRGPGVPRGLEAKIFEQFFRVNDELSNGVQGAGLGLALARQIVRAHGGDLTFEPRPGGGSCFVFHIPTHET